MPLEIGTTQRARPTAIADAAKSVLRSGRYGESLAIPIGRQRHGITLEGGSYRAITNLSGSGVTAGITTSFSPTAGLFYIRNNEPFGGLRYYLEFFRFIPNVIPASATRMELLWAIDNITRYSSAGTQLTVINQANRDSQLQSAAQVYGGALVFAAESTAVRRLGRCTPRTAIPVVHEEYFLDFSGAGYGTKTPSGTAGLRATIPCGPVVLGPGHSFTLHYWVPSNAITAMTCHMEAAWAER